MGRRIKKGSTDQSTVIRIVDSTAFTPETAVEHNTSGIDLWYRREGATKTSITEAALASLDAAHSDGGIEHIGDGYYRLDLPDAACATGVNSVQIGGTVTGMIVIGNEHELCDVDPYDGVRMGMTALPNAAADAAGGLPISDDGGLDLDDLNTNVSAILADTGTDGVKIADDAITAAKFDESTAFPLKSADTGATAVARTGADSDTLETLSDQLDTLPVDSELADAVADEVYDNDGTNDITFRQAVRLFLSALTGKSTGGGTTTLNFRDLADSKNRLTVTVDANGNRTAVGARDGS